MRKLSVNIIETDDKKFVVYFPTKFNGTRSFVKESKNEVGDLIVKELHAGLLEDISDVTSTSI